MLKLFLTVSQQNSLQLLTCEFMPKLTFCSWSPVLLLLLSCVCVIILFWLKICPQILGSIKNIKNKYLSARSSSNTKAVG